MGLTERLLLNELEQNQPKTIFDTPVVDTASIYDTQYDLPKRNFIKDLMSGYQDNYMNRLGATNLPKEKNWATRLGEGLGTVGRFIDSPLGRGLIAGGLNSALGYNNSLQEGLNAAVGRQKARTADSIYRKQLKQMGYTDEDLYNIVGDVTPEIYKGLTDSFRLGNQRMTYGQLALFDPEIAEQVRQNPELANQFMPVMFARDIYGKKNQQAEANIEKIKADTEGSKARTEKTKAETGQVGKPRVTINRREGGTTSRVIMEHKGGGGKTTSQANTTVRPIGQNLKEGTVIKNKQGKKMVLRGGKWQPM